jgi:transcriptional regulator with XRE-family HTH domain
MNLGAAIKALRKNSGLNQVNYASSVGITQSYLSLLENGEKTPSMETLEKMASHSGIPLPLLFWFGIEEKDINHNKVEIFRIMKPTIDEFVKQVLTDNTKQDGAN